MFGHAVTHSSILCHIYTIIVNISSSVTKKLLFNEDNHEIEWLKPILKPILKGALSSSLTVKSRIEVVVLRRQ